MDTNSNSPVNQGTQELKILEQPPDEFRIRYRSEGTNGNLYAQQGKSKKFPKVQLINHDGYAFICCSLRTADSPHKAHMHQLTGQTIIPVSEKNGYLAEFRELTIIREKIQKETNMDLNRVKLCFEAFERDDNGQKGNKLCEIYSCTIHESKSVKTGRLEICRMYFHSGSCSGGDEVVLLVNKVSKDNIEVHFYEPNEGGKEWRECASVQYVHNQSAIVVRTPRYPDQNIKTKVKVKVQLYRPGDNAKSQPETFEYEPSRKRKNSGDSSNSLECSRPSKQAAIALSDLHRTISEVSEKSSYNRSSPSSDNSFNPMVGLDIDDPETFQVLPCTDSSKGTDLQSAPAEIHNASIDDELSLVALPGMEWKWGEELFEGIDMGSVSVVTDSCAKKKSPSQKTRAKLNIPEQKSDDNDADDMLQINKNSSETQDQEDKNFAELQNISLASSTINKVEVGCSPNSTLPDFCSPLFRLCGGPGPHVVYKSRNGISHMHKEVLNLWILVLFTDYFVLGLHYVYMYVFYPKETVALFYWGIVGMVKNFTTWMLIFIVHILITRLVELRKSMRIMMYGKKNYFNKSSTNRKAEWTCTYN